MSLTFLRSSPSELTPLRVAGASNISLGSGRPSLSPFTPRGSQSTSTGRGCESLPPSRGFSVGRRTEGAEGISSVDGKVYTCKGINIARTPSCSTRKKRKNPPKISLFQTFAKKSPTLPRRPRSLLLSLRHPHCFEFFSRTAQGKERKRWSALCDFCVLCASLFLNCFPVALASRFDTTPPTLLPPHLSPPHLQPLNPSYHRPRRHHVVSPATNQTPDPTSSSSPTPPPLRTPLSPKQSTGTLKYHSLNRYLPTTKDWR